MNRILKTFGLSAIAVLALAAFSAAGASAGMPTFQPENNEFPVPFEGSGGAGTLETVSGSTVTCQTNSNTGGEIVDEDTTEGSIVKFNGCKALGLFTCTSAGQSSGTIVTNEVEGELVYTGEGKDEASMLLKPEGSEVFAEFQCFTVSATVTGSVLGNITPVNEFATESTLAFTQSEGIQNSGSSYWDTNGCGTTPAYLESVASGFGGWSLQQSGIEVSATLTTGEEPVKINSSEC